MTTFDGSQASETSERWSHFTDSLDVRVKSVNADLRALQPLEERLEQSIRLLSQLQSQQEEVLVQALTFPPKLEKFHSLLRQVQQRFTRLNDDNRLLSLAQRRSEEKIEHLQRRETQLHSTVEEQERTLTQLRKDLK